MIPTSKEREAVCLVCLSLSLPLSLLPFAFHRSSDVGGPGSIFPQASFADPNNNPLHTPPPLPRTHQLPGAQPQKGDWSSASCAYSRDPSRQLCWKHKATKVDAPIGSRVSRGAALNWGESGATRLVITIQTKKKEQAFLLCYLQTTMYTVKSHGSAGTRVTGVKQPRSQPPLCLFGYTGVISEHLCCSPCCPRVKGHPRISTMLWRLLTTDGVGLPPGPGSAVTGGESKPCLGPIFSHL